MPTIFVVDDEEPIRNLVSYNFQRSGFDVHTCANGREAYNRISADATEFDLVVLDLMLPGMDGLEICKRLRFASVNVPIILLTARDEEVDLVLGLEVGADDYVTKPFSPRELIARARAVLRRSELQSTVVTSPGVSTPVPPVMEVGDVYMDLVGHEVKVRGRTVVLTPKEFELLRYMMAQTEHVMSRDVLLDRVWGYSAATDTRIVDVHVSHLRDKIERDPKNPEYIRTVRGVGYKFMKVSVG